MDDEKRMRRKRRMEEGGETSVPKVEYGSNRRGRREEMGIRVVWSFYKIMVSYDGHVIAFC